MTLFLFKASNPVELFKVLKVSLKGFDIEQ